jgi:hypothetical protein
MVSILIKLLVRNSLPAFTPTVWSVPQNKHPRLGAPRPVGCTMAGIVCRQSLVCIELAHKLQVQYVINNYILAAPSY